MSNGQSNFLAGLSTAARENPLAAALIGGGALWLLMGNRGLHRAFDGAQGMVSSAREGMSATAAPLREAAMRNVRGWQQDRARSQDEQAARSGSYGEGQWRASGPLDGLRENTASLADRAADIKDRAKEAINEGWSRASEAARNVPNPLPAAGSAYQRTRSSLTEIWEQQPLALAVVGLAIGAAVAGAIPPSRLESEWAGEAADRLKQDLGERAEAVKQSLSEAADMLKSEAGQMVAEGADKLRQAGQDAAAAAREAATAHI